jgi:hypothetical protein
LVNAAFGLTINEPRFDENLTLEQALNLGGGNLDKLARQGVAALLNVRSDIDYPYSEDIVFSTVRAGLLSGGEPEATQLANANELGCPLP